MAFDPSFVLHEQVFDGDVDGLLAGEEVLEEEVASRAEESSLSCFDAPECVVEGLPVGVVECFGIELLPCGPQEDVVAQEVCGE